ncbi:MAG: clostripain-related cysteine peptidase [Candidatus Ozemobacteraceae bacterium]
MKRLFVFVLTLVVVLCSAGTAQALNDWTFIIYMSNDDKESAIEDANLRNLTDMSGIGSAKGYEILVQMDGRPSERGLFGSLFGGNKDDLKYSGGQRLVIQKGQFVSEGKLGEVNMGSPFCLWDCVKWAAEKHPAKHYALIFNSHGSGLFSWRGTGGTSSSKPGAVDFDPDRFVAYDTTDNDCLTVFEISAVMKAFREKINSGRKMDIVGFDACLPGNIEVLFQMREGFDYMIGSPDTTPIYGFNYRGMVMELSKNPSIAPESFATTIAQTLGSRLIGAWRTAKAQEISFSVNNIAMELLKAAKETGQKFTIGAQTSFGGKDRYWDLEKVGMALRDGNGSFSTAKNAQIIKQYGGELLEAIKAARVTGFGNITIASPVPTEYQQWKGFYKALDFAQATQWDEMLDVGALEIK